MLLLLASLCLSMTTPLAPEDVGGSQGCADKMACQVDGKFEEQGNPRTCGLGFTLFGAEISFGGDECFPIRLFTPAHQVCHGKPNRGTRCVKEQDLDVLLERCDCARLGVVGTGIALPECVCTAGGSQGRVEDFKTANCEQASTSGGTHTGGGL